MSLVSLLIAAAAAVAGAVGDMEEEEQMEAYSKKLVAYKKEQDRIREFNRQKSERFDRRNTLARSIDADMTFYNPKLKQVPGEEGEVDLRTKMDAVPGSSSGSQAEKWLGAIGQSYGALDSAISNLDTDVSAFYNPSVSTLGGYSPTASPSSTFNYQAPDTNSYSYTEKYNPKKRYLTSYD